MTTLGVVLAVGQPVAQPGLWGHRWPEHPLGSVGLWWLELAGLVLTLLVAVVLAEWWRDRFPGPEPTPRGRRPAGPPGQPVGGGQGPNGVAAPGMPAATSAPAVDRAAAPGSRAVRTSDAERDEATGRVSWAVGEGRLDLDEAVRRVEAILGARHRQEVAALVADLPAPPATPRHPAGAGRRAFLAGTALVALVAVLAQAFTGLWELWPVALVAVGAWGARRR